MDNARASLSLPDPRDWLAGLDQIGPAPVPVVPPGYSRTGKHVIVSKAAVSSATRDGERLVLEVAPFDHGFACALIAAFGAGDGVPAAAAPASRALLAMVARVAPHDVGIIIEGATGTGKEGLARMVHTLSLRSASPLVAVNCAALPEAMLEATLFGHERGAFSGAVGASPGLFRAANGGTLLLDEVSELPLVLQAKLLRVLQEREVLPIGAVRPEKVDVRIIAAANRDLAGDVAAGRFRSDLYYRLAVFPLRTIPLCQRRADIVAIAAHWLLKASTGRLCWPTPAALAQLLAYEWPGNVRELGNVLDRAMVFADGPVIGCEHLAFDEPATPVGEDAALPLPGSVRHHEDRLIRRVLAETHDRRSAAQRLGISERTLRYKLAAMAVGPLPTAAMVQ